MSFTGEIIGRNDFLQLVMTFKNYIKTAEPTIVDEDPKYHLHHIKAAKPFFTPATKIHLYGGGVDIFGFSNKGRKELAHFFESRGRKKGFRILDKEGVTKGFVIAMAAAF